MSQNFLNCLLFRLFYVARRSYFWTHFCFRAYAVKSEFNDFPSLAKDWFLPKNHDFWPKSRHLTFTWIDKKHDFWPKITILGQRSWFWSKIVILVKNRGFHHNSFKSKKFVQIMIFDKNHAFWPKIMFFLLKIAIFGQKLWFLAKNRDFW